MVKLQDMCSFLESLFIDFGNGIGCLRESPNVEANVCYTNTNFLALQVLKMCNSAIVPKLEAFLQQYNREREHNTRILLLYDIPLPIQSVKRVTLGTKTVDNTTITIYADVLSGETLPDWYDYADLTIYTALEYLLRKDFANAWKYRGYAQRMWVGKGFADKSYYASNLFETYKLSLYYFLMRALRYRDSIVDWIEENIDRFMVDGGVITHYNNNLTPHGDPNVETTSITALAFYSNYPNMFPLYVRGSFVSPFKPLENAISSAISAVAGFGMGITLARILRKLVP